MNISCIIPTFNGLHLLQKHLPSVFTALADGDEVVIVDDGSTDESVNWLKDHFNLKKAELSLSSGIPVGYCPVASSELCRVFSGRKSTKSKTIAITVIQNKENMRFGASVNLACCLIKHSYFLLLNNDVSVDEQAVKVLKEQVVSDHSIFAIGCLEYEDDTTGQQSGKNRLWFERGLFQHAKAKSFDSGETAWASGGSALFSAEKWFKLGGFDKEYYPAYWEDIDISFRAKQRGWKVLFNADAIVFHQHESTNAPVFGKDVITSISWKNAFRFAWKNSTVIQKVSILFWYPYWQIQRLKTTEGTT